MQVLSEKYFSQVTSTSVLNLIHDKGKVIMGEAPLGYSIKDAWADLGPKGANSRMTRVDTSHWGFRIDCPQFDDSNFRSWWSKLDQYFEAENILGNARVRVVMLNLDRRELEWHHFFAQRHGGLPSLTWDTYTRALKERFGTNSFLNPMSVLVALKQQCAIDQYLDSFLSLLNQHHLPDDYALDIFVSNLKIEIRQYILLFKPKILVEGYLMAKQVEEILGYNQRKFWPSQIGSHTKRATLPPTLSSPTRSFLVPRLTHGSSSIVVGNQKGSTKSLSLVDMEDRRKKRVVFLVYSQILSRAQVCQITTVLGNARTLP
ncbi:uncharacterized protein LOC128290524 [Gossypium arboreum]|uniref:uncharacterized protein LOC128290524 n=1 Tax=Gossypium arboreum TaxID=29729 RepID=UPI0022F1D293|nr:uncharacterized protein LOC128290524 [Gossypium arboreum]